MKTVFTRLSFLLLAISLFSCSSDDDSAPVEETLTTQEILLQYSPYNYDRNSVTFIDYNERNETNDALESYVSEVWSDISFNFLENNKVQFITPEFSVVADYNINSNNNLILTYNDEDLIFENFDVNTDRMKFDYLFEDEYENGDFIIFTSEVVFK